MEENRKILFYLEKAGNASYLERAIAKVNGVLSVKVDVKNLTLEYLIDEWASDYDVFTEVMRICSECGAAIDFDREEKTQVEQAENVETVESEEQIVAEVEEVEEIQEDSKNKKQEKRLLSERAQRIIEISVAVVAFGVALFLKDIAQYIFLAISFAIAGYDALYEAFVKITKKQFVSEELIISIAFFVAIILGYANFAVAALLLYSIVAFARKTIKEEIDKHPTFSKGGQTVAMATEDGVINVESDKVEVGNAILVDANNVVIYDGTPEEQCEVEDFKGNVRSVEPGEEIYAGEKVLCDVKLTVTAIGENCKFGKYNSFVNKASNETEPLSAKIEKHSQLINICVLAFCLLITFIPPLFTQNYSNALAKWAYKAVIIATVSGLGFYTFATQINMLSALIRGRKCKLGFAGYRSLLSLSKADKIFLDYENALLDANKNLQEDCVGAVRELKDAKLKDIAIVCSLSDDHAEDICKQLKVKQYYSRTSEEDKNAQLKLALEQGGVVATSASNYENVKSELGATVCFNCESEGYVGDVSVATNEIAYLPYALKLARRTAKIQKVNLALGLAVKAVLVVLALLGIAQLWWAVLADSIVSVICALNAFINSKEIY